MITGPHPDEERPTLHPGHGLTHNQPGQVSGSFPVVEYGRAASEAEHGQRDECVGCCEAEWENLVEYPLGPPSPDQSALSDANMHVAKQAWIEDVRVIDDDESH